ncbi:MAG: hypothetical protein GTO29_03725, partial [Candidatus Latescibacteria bacterium]|nr:hypothetical protein [Candidatus Latescibacterota bacterium]
AYKKFKKREAAALAAEAKQNEAVLDQQLAQFYNQHEQSHFVPAGYNRSRWNSLTQDQKVSLIKKLQAG